MSVHDHANFLARLKAQNYEIDVIYDVGANIGRWSIEAAKVYPNAKFELFEPLVGLNPELDESARFDLIKANFNLHEIALADKNGTRPIKILGDRGVGSSILVMDGDYRKDTQIVDVKTSTMDDFVKEKNLPYPDFIKLDTQASELKILQHATECLKHASYCLVETWMRKVYGPETPLLYELSVFMDSQGYQQFEFLIPDQGRDADGTLRWLDIIFINKNVVEIPPGWY